MDVKVGSFCCVHSCEGQFCCGNDFGQVRSSPIHHNNIFHLPWYLGSLLVHFLETFGWFLFKKQQHNAIKFSPPQKEGSLWVIWSSNISNVRFLINMYHWWLDTWGLNFHLAFSKIELVIERQFSKMHLSTSNDDSFLHRGVNNCTHEAYFLVCTCKLVHAS